MATKMLNKKYGFSLIELVVYLAIFGTLFSGTLLIGLPEYNRYILDTERQNLVDIFLESRSLAITNHTNYGVRLWQNRYCMISTIDCIRPVYFLPDHLRVSGLEQGMFSSSALFSDAESESTSTDVLIYFENSTSTARHININKNGFIDGR